MGDFGERFADGEKEKKLKRISGETTSHRRNGSRGFHGLQDATSAGCVQRIEKILSPGDVARGFRGNAGSWGRNVGAGA
jgi:hypothetical protein